jgi:hypothetical protein
MTPSTLYAGTYQSGIFKSMDSGGKWSAMNTGLTKMGIYSIAIDPQTPNILYVGTIGGGVFKYESAVPQLQTDEASNINIDSAVLQGAINPLNMECIYYFEYGKDVTYGSKTSAVNLNATNDNQTVTMMIDNLIPATAYHYRLVAENLNGTAFGKDHSFKTVGQPQLQAYAASNIDNHSAVLHGMINPMGPACIYYFEYGTDTTYGLMTLPILLDRNANNITVQEQINNLMPATTYHYRLTAMNINDIYFGIDCTLQTTDQSNPPQNSGGGGGGGGGCFIAAVTHIGYLKTLLCLFIIFLAACFFAKKREMRRKF